MHARPGRRMLDLHLHRRRAMTTETIEELGPVDIVVIGYPADAPMTGSAGQILLDEVDKGTISVLDALFVTKGQDGTYSGFDATGLEQGRVGDFHVFEGASSGLLPDDALPTDAARIDPGTPPAI